MKKNTKSKTVLIIEDDENTRNFISKVIELEGYDVLKTASGLEGIKLIEKNKLDLVLLDIKLPDIEGWEILSKVKNNPITINIPVIIFSAYAGVIDYNRAIKAGASAYLSKPVSASDLRKALTSSLQK